MNSKELDKWSSEEDDKSIKWLLSVIIDRINFFGNFYKKLDKISELPRIYDWFLYANLLNLYKFAEAFEIHNHKALNEFNPFYIWARYYNAMRHLDVEREISRNDFEFAFCYKNLNELKFQNRKEYKNETNMWLVQKLKEKFYNDIANWNSFNTEYLLIDKKLKKWNEIKIFLQFILDELPENNVLDTETDFYKNRFQLWKFYLEKTNKK